MATPYPAKQIERHTQVGSVPITYEVSGSGPPLVLIHGLSGSGAWWARNIGVLSQHFRVYSIDLIGFGASPRNVPFALNKAAQVIVGWMDQIGIERASVIGHSMGGFITADLAADFPERVDRVVLVSAAAVPFSRGYFGHALGLTRACAHLPLDFWPTLLHDARRAGAPTIWRAAQELITADIREKLPAIRAPTMVIWGQHDTLVPLEMGKQLCRLLPSRPKLTVLRNAGHNPMWDTPRAFNRLVLEFLGAGEAAQATSSAAG